MYRIIYLSTATINFSDEDYEELLDVARKNNSQKDITGLLIIKGRSFLQCLEGEKNKVNEIYEKIEKDNRHNNIIKIIEEEDDQRLFPTWSMGYKNFTHIDKITSPRLIDFSQTENIRSLSSDFISDIFKEFIEVSN